VGEVEECLEGDPPLCLQEGPWEEVEVLLHRLLLLDLRLEEDRLQHLEGEFLPVLAFHPREHRLPMGS
jgi:hypothetical protein